MNDQMSHGITTIHYTEKVVLECVRMFRMCEKSITADLHPVVAFSRRHSLLASVFSGAIDAWREANPGKDAAHHFTYAVAEIVYCLQNREETEMLVASNPDYGIPVAGLGSWAVRIYRKIVADEELAK